MGDIFLTNLTFQDCLGSGAFGIVFAAQNTLTHVQSAVKFVCKDSTLSDKEQLELERESILCRQLPQHTNVVTILDVVEKDFKAPELKALWKKSLLMTEDQHVIRDQIIGMAKRHGRVTLLSFQMEMCGTTLRHWLEDPFIRRMDAQDLHSTQFMILRDSSEGLKFLHRNKIIHRDIKPENVMFSLPSNEYAFPLKVGDFGLCRLCHGSETKTSTLTAKAGTWDYMAPEVVHGKYGQQCDIYSFGLVTWEVIQLIPGKSRKQMFDALINDREYDAIENHAVFHGMKETIISMTMRKEKERMETLDAFRLSYITPRRPQLDHMGKSNSNTTLPSTNVLATQPAREERKSVLDQNMTRPPPPGFNFNSLFPQSDTESSSSAVVAAPTERGFIKKPLSAGITKCRENGLVTPLDSPAFPTILGEPNKTVSTGNYRDVPCTNNINADTEARKPVVLPSENNKNSVRSSRNLQDLSLIQSKEFDPHPQRLLPSKSETMDIGESDGHVLTPKNGEELSHDLVHGKCNTIVLHPETEYRGNFEIKRTRNNVTLQGQRGSTIVGVNEGVALKVLGNNCMISDICFLGPNGGIWLWGDNNVVQRCVWKNKGKNRAIYIAGVGNHVMHVRIEGHRGDKCIQVKPRENVFENVEMVDCEGILHCSDPRCSFIRCKFANTGGRPNVIENTGSVRAKDVDFGFLVIKRYSAKGIKGLKVQLDGCKGENLVFEWPRKHIKVEHKNCQFSEIVYSE